MQTEATTSRIERGLRPPSALYGSLFARVQESGLFPDSKTFADAEPLREPAAILADYARRPPADNAALRAFVDANFAIPPANPDDVRVLARDLDDYIYAMWSRLERPAVVERGSALGVTQRHVVPGGRFREIYYWDSYFTMLGLAGAGRQDLVEDMVDLFAGMIERFGHIPNGARSYYLSRSQPPVFYLMAALSRRRGDARLIAAMRREHDYWMSGGRVVTLAGEATLNRYWDDCDTPRDESWAEDMATARRSGRSPADVFRDIRAGAESGWDFSSRWLADGKDMATIRTTRIVPCCLNALLHGLEYALADAGDAAMAKAAERRRAAMARYTWNEAGGFFTDFLIDEARPSDALSAAAFYPLFTRSASPDAAARTIAAGARLIARGGLRTTLEATGQQWDAPNGWAPLQWIACLGMEAYGAEAAARDLARRWVVMVTAQFARSRRLYEKYDVEAGAVGAGGEYEVQEGFGWTNGVTAALKKRFGFV